MTIATGFAIVITHLHVVVNLRSDLSLKKRGRAEGESSFFQRMIAKEVNVLILRHNTNRASMKTSMLIYK